MKLFIAAALAVRLERPIDNQALLYEFTTGSPTPADETANGDSADNKDLREESDTKDWVVDYNGGTNRGYGSTRPKDFFEGNHIADGHFGTLPRGDRESNQNWVPYSNEELGYAQPHDDLSYPNNPGTIQWNK